jgi:hypothetical protein
MATPDESKPSDSPACEPSKGASEKDLPIVESPKLDGSEGVAAPAIAAAKEGAAEPSGETGASASLSRSRRFALLAASVVCAAMLGSLIGSLSASGLAHLWSSAPAAANLAQANTLPAIKAELAELATLKANLDVATRSANSQLAKIADRLDRVERAEIEPAVKLAHIVEAVDRLEKKAATASVAPAAPETTGSIASSQAASSPVATKLPDRPLQGWVVQEVRGGRVLVASRYGGVFEVVTGAILPGLGRVETIKRQDGQWIVVTERGLIAER